MAYWLRLYNVDMKSLSSISGKASGSWYTIIFSSVFLGISLLHVNFFWLVLPGIILFIHYIFCIDSWQKAFLGSWLMGTAKALGGFAWVWHSYPLGMVDFESPFLQLFFIGLFWVSTSLSMGLGMTIVGLVVFKVKKMASALLYVPLLWVAGEVLGSLFTSIFWLGPGSFMNFYLVHGYIGLTIANFPMFYPWSKVAGIYGLSFLITVFSVVVYFFIKKFQHSRLAALLPVFILASSVLIFNFLLSPESAEKQNTRVVVIDTRFVKNFGDNAQELDIRYNEIKEATLKALTLDPDVVLLPEDARLTHQFDDDKSLLEFLSEAFPTSTALVVDSAYTQIEGGYGIQRARYYDLDRGDIYSIDKQFLAPQGEYITYIFDLILKMGSYENFRADVEFAKSYRQGPIKNYKDFPNDIPGLFFCFDSSSAIGAKVVRAQRENPIVLHPVSHSWFHNPFLFLSQLDSLLRIQSLWSKSIIVKAGNQSESKVYLPDGAIETGETKEVSRYWTIIQYDL